MKVFLNVMESRSYFVEEDEADRLRMLALMGPLELIPDSVHRSAYIVKDDEVNP